MANEERSQQQVFQDVDPSQLGQLSPGHTPHNSDLQNQNRGRGRGLGRGGENHQLGKTTGQPRFTEMGSEKLLEAGQAAAENLKQYQDRAEAQQRDKNFVGDRFGTLDEKTNTKITQKLHETDNNLEQNTKLEKEKQQEKENDHER